MRVPMAIFIAVFSVMTLSLPAACTPTRISPGKSNGAATPGSLAGDSLAPSLAQFEFDISFCTMISTGGMLTEEQARVNYCVSVRTKPNPWGFGYDLTGSVSVDSNLVTISIADKHPWHVDSSVEIIWHRPPPIIHGDMDVHLDRVEYELHVTYRDKCDTYRMTPRKGPLVEQSEGHSYYREWDLEPLHVTFTEYKVPPVD